MRLPKGADTPSVADFSALGALEGPVSAGVALLSKGKVLENLLNHLEDLKGTPFQAAAEALAEKAPWVFGHINKVLPRSLGEGKHGLHWIDSESGLSQIAVNPTQVNTGLFSAPADTLGHEATHAAQALMEGGPSTYLSRYAKELGERGYQGSKYEVGARKAGVALRKRAQVPPRKEP